MTMVIHRLRHSFRARSQETIDPATWDRSLRPGVAPGTWPGAIALSL